MDLKKELEIMGDMDVMMSPEWAITKVISLLSRVNSDSFNIVIGDENLEFYAHRLNNYKINHQRQEIKDGNNNRFHVLSVKQIERKNAIYSFMGSEVSALITPYTLAKDVQEFLSTRVRSANKENIRMEIRY